MNYTIKEKQFTYTNNYKNDSYIRGSFNTLVQKTFGFNFEQWYQDGYWKDKYMPHSLLFEDAVVANVSVNIIDFDVYGEKRRYIQIGTVMTDLEFRNMGLNRFLMEKIMEQWTAQCDMIYLFANDSVLDYYPKFGFVKANEFQLSKEVNNISPVMSAKKIDMDDIRNRQALLEKINRKKAVSVLEMKDNVGLIMFYCTSFMKDNIYYISKFDAYIVAEFYDNVFYLQDIFCEFDLSLDEIINAIAIKNIEKIVLGFTPRCLNGFEKNLLQAENTTLFAFGEDVEFFRNNQMMFLVLSHA